jgi:hypothetical protein
MVQLIKNFIKKSDEGDHFDLCDCESVTYDPNKSLICNIFFL